MRHSHLKVLDSELTSKPLSHLTAKPHSLPILDAFTGKVHENLYWLVVIYGRSSPNHIPKAVHSISMTIGIVGPWISHQTYLPDA